MGTDGILQHLEACFWSSELVLDVPSTLFLPDLPCVPLTLQIHEPRSSTQCLAIIALLGRCARIAALIADNF